MNKYLANASHAPETLRKWYAPATTPRCPQCHSLTKADLHHLIWFCPKLSRYRNFLPLTNDSTIPIDPRCVDTPTLHQIALFGVSSSLARAVYCCPLPNVMPTRLPLLPEHSRQDPPYSRVHFTLPNPLTLFPQQALSLPCPK